MYRLDRKELKYFVSEAEKARLIEAFRERMTMDEHADQGQTYPIISQYLDSDGRQCYWEKADGLKHRRKLRIRIYGDGSGGVEPTVFLEVKAKSYGRGVKRRIQLPLHVVEDLSRGDTQSYDALERPDCRAERMMIAEVRSLVQESGFSANMAIRYDRLAFQGCPESADLRITFDSDVQCRTRSKPLEAGCMDFDHSLLPAGTSLMEVKFMNGLPLWTVRLFTGLGLRPRSFSKYCTALEQHDPIVAGSSLVAR